MHRRDARKAANPVVYRGHGERVGVWSTLEPFGTVPSCEGVVSAPIGQEPAFMCDG
jgi:hypothetical protein